MSGFARIFGESPFVFAFSDTLAPQQRIQIELEYVEVVEYSNDRYQYSYPFRSNARRGSSLKAWSVDVMSGRPILDVTVAPFNTEPTVVSAEHISVNIGETTVTEATLTCTYRVEYDGLTMNVLSTKPEGEDGYAIMTAVPKSRIENNEVLPKRFIFVLDNSGSMSGSKVLQAKDAALYCVQRLNAGDVFNVEKFNNAVTTWKEAPVEATPANIAGAVKFIDNIQAGGGTDIMAALSAALASMRTDNFVNVIIFLTDGEAPVDHASLKQLNTTGTRIFVFGVGAGVNTAVLKQIAVDHNGACEFVTMSSEVVPSISRLFEKIKDPLVKNPAVTFSPDVMYDVYPSIIPDIYAGEQLQLVGRYTMPGDITVTVNGSDHQGPVRHDFVGALTNDPDVNLFVPKIWARFRIDMLLDWMSKEVQGSGLWKEWRDEIIRLGLEHGIVTPFTSFVDDGQTEDPDDDQSDPGNTGDPTSFVDEEGSLAPSPCTISPNPVHDHATITVDLSSYQGSMVRLTVIDINGRLITTLFEGTVTTPMLSIYWSVSNDTGMLLSQGVYFLSVEVDGVRSLTQVNVTR